MYEILECLHAAKCKQKLRVATNITHLNAIPHHNANYYVYIDKILLQISNLHKMEGINEEFKHLESPPHLLERRNVTPK